MALSDSRHQVLRMVEEGGLSPRDGARLLMALGEIGAEPLSGEPQEVLRMIKEATVSVEDGIRLIISLGELRAEEPEPHRGDSSDAPGAADTVKQVHLTMKQKDGNVVKLSIPLHGARMVLPLFDLPHAALLGEHGIDINQIREALIAGEPGDVILYHDEESGNSVHIAIR